METKQICQIPTGITLRLRWEEPRLLRFSELFKCLIMTHSSWSKIERERRKRKHDSPLLVAGWSSQLILDIPLYGHSLTTAIMIRDGRDVNSSNLKLVAL